MLLPSLLAGHLLLLSQASFAAACTDLPLFDGSESIIAANAAAYQLIKTDPSTVAGKLEFVCPTGSALGYAQGDNKLSVEPELKLTCESQGWWVRSPNRVDGLLTTVKIGCFKELPTKLPAAPVSTVPKEGCGCWYEPSACRTCDLQKLFVLEGQGAMSAKCTLGCAKGYVLEGGEMNMITCQDGYWIGSSRSETNVTVGLTGPFGYITTSCVPAPTSGKCSVSYNKFECEGCDKTKIIALPSPKSAFGCVLACDKGYRLLILDGIAGVIRAQEAVAEQGFLTVYRLGDVKNPIRVDWATRQSYSCEPTTADLAVPVKLIDPKAPTTTPPPPACDATYEINTACQDCDKNQLKNLPTTDKCTIGCNDGYVLLTNSANWISSAQPAIQASFTTEWEALRFDGSKKLQLGSVEQSVGPPLFANCRPFTTTRCAYKINTACLDCDKSQLVNLPTADKCTIGCNDGFRLITNSANWISSAIPAVEASFTKQWAAIRFDDSKSVIGGSLFANCRPFTSSTPLHSCDYEINTVCADCDKSQLRNLRTSDKCTVGCAEGFVLITNSANWISSALPALQASFTKEWEALRFDGTKTLILGQVGQSVGPPLFANCRPLTPPAPTTTTTPQPVQTTTTTTPAPTVPPPPVETCGCPYTADVSNSAYDSTQLFVMDTGTGRCTLQCDAGYRLAGAMSSVACKDGKEWYYQKADNATHPTYDFTPGNFSCEVAPATCDRPYVIAPCRPDKECNPSAITKIKGAKGNCILSCARGYQLLQYSSDGAVPHHPMQEVYFDTTAYSGAGGWNGIPLGETKSTTHFNQPTVITVTCERYVSPAEQSRIPPDTEKRRCGCPYDFSGCPTCAWKQLFRIDGFGDWSDRCTLGCGKGYMFEGGQVNMLTCKKGQGWFGSPRTTNGAPVRLGNGDKITTSCVPVTSPATCSIQYATFECANSQCYSKYLVALASPKSPCVLSCDKGYRLAVIDASGAVIRAQEAVLEQGSWKVYPLGDTQSTISIPLNVIKFSCEGAILALNTLTPI